MKIGAAGVYDQIALQQWGAIPVSLSTEEIYNALAEGIVDASFGMTPQDFVTIGAQDTAKYFIETGYGTAGPLYTVINIDSYNKLTPDIQRILDEVSNEAALKHGEIRTESIRKTIPEILNAGGEIYALSAEIQAELYTSAKQPSRSAWIRNMIKAKANVEIARQVLALYIQFVDKYKSRSTSKEIVEIYIQELGG
jgi:TRAP-type C4-dicarboxylate transport system substrate-binding protein